MPFLVTFVKRTFLPILRSTTCAYTNAKTTIDTFWDAHRPLAPPKSGSKVTKSAMFYGRVRKMQNHCAIFNVEVSAATALRCAEERTKAFVTQF